MELPQAIGASGQSLVSHVGSIWRGYEVVVTGNGRLQQAVLPIGVHVVCTSPLTDWNTNPHPSAGGGRDSLSWWTAGDTALVPVAACLQICPGERQALKTRPSSHDACMPQLVPPPDGGYLPGNHTARHTG